jgi:hypothetical protein
MKSAIRAKAKKVLRQKTPVYVMLPLGVRIKEVIGIHPDGTHELLEIVPAGKR